MKGRVVAFIHTYAQDGQLGSFMNEFTEAFDRLGVKLYLILANDLVGRLSNSGYKVGISEERVLDYIRDIDPDFILTTNRAGITKKLMLQEEYQIITWMVDRIPFRHHGGTDADVFCERDIVVAASRDAVEYYEKTYPVLIGRVHLIPFATNLSSFTPPTIKDINTIFVGTYFYSQDFTKIVQYCSRNNLLYQKLLKFVAEVENDYSIDIDNLISSLELEVLLTHFSLTPMKLKGLVANTISLNRRIKYLDAISDLGLQLYGTTNWINVNQFSLSLLKCYNAGVFVKERQDLISLYQRSKLALNVSHHQAQSGLPYRIFDIMASDALLVTEYDKNSDLFHFFGKDVPVQMYRNERELRKITKHFTIHENERECLVAKCNELIAKGHSFTDRVKAFYSLIGVTLKDPEGQQLYLGDVERVDNGLKGKWGQIGNGRGLSEKDSKGRISVDSVNFQDLSVASEISSSIAQYLYEKVKKNEKVIVLLKRLMPESLRKKVARLILI